MPLLATKAAIVTAAASGIGRSTALRFASEGASVAIVDVQAQSDPGNRVVTEITQRGGRAAFIACDVSKPDDVRRMVQRTADEFGGIHIAVANAGINGVWAPIEELGPDEWDKTLDINLKGTFLTLHYAIPHLRRAGGGSVIITSSVNGNRTFFNAGASAYSTSKAGQVALMKMAALELAQYNIRVNAILPGAIRTNIHQRTVKRDTEEVEIKVELPEGPPGIDQGQGDPEEVADVCLFLASHLSRHVSGVELYVDGGASLLM